MNQINDNDKKRMPRNIHKKHIMKKKKERKKKKMQLKLFVIHELRILKKLQEDSLKYYK